MKANIINCTPHAIVIDNEKEFIGFAPSGSVARVKVETKFRFDLDGIPGLS